MKKFYLLLLFAVTGLISCHQDEFEDYNMSQQAVLIPGPVWDVPIVSIDGGDSMTLGNRLENPYSVVNMRRAYDSMAPELSDAGIEVDDITTTHFYVKFKPDNEAELQSIKDSYAAFDIYEYPLDYEISGRVSYHDPEIPDSLPTYQYASIDSLSWTTIPVPQNVEFEILERLFIPDEDLDDINLTVQSRGTTSYNDAVEALVNRSLLLTGNLEDEEETPENGVLSSGSTWYPSGRITAYDDILDAQVPLEGVKVRVRRWFTTCTTTTDEGGFFTIPKSFKNKVNYLIIWDGPKWNIRDGKYCQAYYNGPKKQGVWNLEIANNSSKSIRYATIHRAVYRMKIGNVDGLSRIPTSYCTNIGYLHGKSSDGYYGAYLKEEDEDYWIDIEICGKDKDDIFIPIHEVLSTVYHELGHSSHYTNASSKYKNSSIELIESWASFVGYYLTLKEYKEFGFDDGPFNILEEELEDGTIVEYCEPDGIINRQIVPVMQGYKYFPLFIDMYDTNNQYITNMYYWQNSESLLRYMSDDRIQNISAGKIEDIVFESTTIQGTKFALIQYMRSNTSLMNTVQNLTQETINLLYLPYEENL